MIFYASWVLALAIIFGWVTVTPALLGVLACLILSYVGDRRVS